MAKQIRITWRHEVIINADSIEEAKIKWETIDFGALHLEQENNEIYSHEFVEEISCEERT